MTRWFLYLFQVYCTIAMNIISACISVVGLLLLLFEFFIFHLHSNTTVWSHVSTSFLWDFHTNLELHFKFFGEWSKYLMLFRIWQWPSSLVYSLAYAPTAIVVQTAGYIPKARITQNFSNKMECIININKCMLNKLTLHSIPATPSSWDIFIIALLFPGSCMSEASFPRP